MFLHGLKPQRLPSLQSEQTVLTVPDEHSVRETKDGILQDRCLKFFLFLASYFQHSRIFKYSLILAVPIK